MSDLGLNYPTTLNLKWTHPFDPFGLKVHLVTTNLSDTNILESDSNRLDADSSGHHNKSEIKPTCLIRRELLCSIGDKIIIHLSLCLLGNSAWFLSSADFFQNPLFRKILSGKPSECQTLWIQIRPDKRRGLFWSQTVCKSYQQPTLVCRKNCLFVVWVFSFIDIQITPVQLRERSKSILIV